VCGDGIDNNCDGVVDEGCVCSPGQTQGCATGQVGACAVGIRTCNATGTAFSTCVGPSPVTETCNGIDDNCNGVVDDGNPGGGQACSCPGGATGVTACFGAGGLICVCQ
jgi:hypothetical protein